MSQSTSSNSSKLNIESLEPMILMSASPLGDMDATVNGDGGDNVLGATSANELISGRDGNDNLFGDGGNDVLLGGQGDDKVRGGSGNDRLHGGEGDDQLFGHSGNDLLNGGKGDDLLVGGAGFDIAKFDASLTSVRFVDRGDEGIEVHSTDGIDLVRGVERFRFADGTLTSDQVREIARNENSGSVVVGTAGSDQLSGTDREDVLFGNQGNDTFVVDRGGNDIYVGGQGNDTLIVANSATNPLRKSDFRFLEDGALQIRIFGRMHTLYGIENIQYGDRVITGEELRSLGSDIIAGSDLVDQINAGAGDDTIHGKSGNDVIDAGDGVDVIDGGAGDDTIDGGEAWDFIQGGTGNDTLDGGGRNDVLLGEEGDDQLIGGTYTDVLFGGIGNDTLDGGNRPDMLYGGRGNDLLIAGDASDILDGGEGDDILVSEADHLSSPVKGSLDILTGGSGADTFRFKLTETATARDLNSAMRDGVVTDDELSQLRAAGKTAVSAFDKQLITDFSRAEGDKIEIEGNGVEFKIVHQVGSDGNHAQSIIRLSHIDASGKRANMGEIVVQGDRVDESDITLKSDENEVVRRIGVNTNKFAQAHIGTNGSDRFDLTQNSGGNGEILKALGGDDVVTHGEGRQAIDAGSGNDIIISTVDQAEFNKKAVLLSASLAESEVDLLFGGTGHDVITGGSGGDFIDGGIGNDILIGESGGDIVLGGRGNDIIFGNTADSDRLTGGEGADSFRILSGGPSFVHNTAIEDFNRSAGDKIEILATSQVTPEFKRVDSDGDGKLDATRVTWTDAGKENALLVRGDQVNASDIRVRVHANPTTLNLSEQLDMLKRDLGKQVPQILDEAIKTARGVGL